MWTSVLPHLGFPPMFVGFSCSLAHNRQRHSKPRAAQKTQMAAAFLESEGVGPWLFHSVQSSVNSQPALGLSTALIGSHDDPRKTTALGEKNPKIDFWDFYYIGLNYSTLHEIEVCN